jgi:hypothetical protein
MEDTKAHIPLLLGWSHSQLPQCGSGEGVQREASGNHHTVLVDVFGIKAQVSGFLIKCTMKTLTWSLMPASHPHTLHETQSITSMADSCAGNVSDTHSPPSDLCDP